jgi:hypothetical protein
MGRINLIHGNRLRWPKFLLERARASLQEQPGSSTASILPETSTVAKMETPQPAGMVGGILVA